VVRAAAANAPMSRSQRYRRRRRGRHTSHILLAVMVLLVLVGIAGASVVGWVAATAASAPALTTLKERDPGSNTEVLAADGTRLGWIQADELSRPVSGDKLPKLLKDATIAIEDERFYNHQGVDYEGIVRAAVENIGSGETIQGGSTISMQLVRNLYTADRARDGIEGYKRKIREAKLAEELENEHSKEWILEKYINTVPYGTVGGQTAIGAEAASLIYFGKHVQSLDLHEAALLAGLPQAPSLYSPITNPGGAKARRDEVLRKMGELDMVTETSAARAMERDLDLKPSRYFSRRRESYFFDYVKDELIKEYGAQKVRLGGLVVHTTVDLEKQQQARAAIDTRMGDIGPSSAVVSIDPRNGKILAMASSGDYGESKFNLAAQGHRQPGSAFKTMALMTALRQGVDPDTTSYVSRSPIHINEPSICGAPFETKTYDGSSRGSISLRRATLASDNSVYIQLAVDLGPDKIVETAHDLGITSQLNGYCAESLGGLEQGVSPLEMANAYATIASGGYRNRPTAITKVEHPDGTTELPRRWRKKRTKEFTDGVAYKAVEILQQNIVSGTGGNASIGCPSAGGKTGTTDNNTDAWFVGFTPLLSTAVWVGYPNDRTYMSNLYYGGPVDGGTFPAEIWGTYMGDATNGRCPSFPQPKEPFVASPFFGEYSRSGGGSFGSDDDASYDETYVPPPAPTEEAPQERESEEGGAGFDPEQYESPPQDAPKIEPPAGETPGVTPEGGAPAPGGGAAPPGDDG
jgi:penicillin-binding protein 1A